MCHSNEYVYKHHGYGQTNVHCIPGLHCDRQPHMIYPSRTNHFLPQGILTCCKLFNIIVNVVVIDDGRLSRSRPHFNEATLAITFQCRERVPISAHRAHAADCGQCVLGADGRTSADNKGLGPNEGPSAPNERLPSENTRRSTNDGLMLDQRLRSKLKPTLIERLVFIGSYPSNANPMLCHITSNANPFCVIPPATLTQCSFIPPAAINQSSQYPQQR